jgi:hypothetical protein
MNSRISIRRCVLVASLAAGALAAYGSGASSLLAQSSRAAEHADQPCSHAPFPPSAVGLDTLCPPAAGSSGITRGDFNGDGVGDLAIGVPGEDIVVIAPITGVRSTVQDAGAVHILYGTAANGLVTSGSSVPATRMLSELASGFGDQRAEAQDSFGASLASGDFNGDGVSDLAVGLVGERTTGTSSIGAVAVYLGSSSGLPAAPSAFFGPTTFTRSQDPGNARAAASLTWGDFNGDGFGDLGVASEYTLDNISRTGAVTVLFGSPGALTVEGKQLLETTLVNVETHPRASLILAAADFNLDGFSDLVAGSPFRDFGGSLWAGAVHVVRGSATGVLDTPQQTFDESVANVPSDPAQFERFGAAVSIGDFNGDGFPDLAIGAPDERIGTVNGGAVFVIHGSPSGLATPATGALVPQIWSEASQSSFGTVEANDQFGTALAANDFNGDGFTDLAIGEPGEDVPAGDDAGVVHVIYGSAFGLSLNQTRSPQHITQSSTLGDPIEAGDRFGTALSAWNFGRSSARDLAVGVPREDVGTAQDAGLVHVIYGSSTGLTTTGNQVWRQGAGGLPDAAEANDHFGEAVY